MRHQMANRKLGRTSSHRSALFRNQLASIIQHERIVTTLIKAKELRPIVEKMITLGKTDDVHHRRLAARSIAEKPLLQKLFDDISPRFTERPGGYTRIIKLGPRRGDGAEMAILEFVDYDDRASAAPATETAKEAKGGDEGEEKPKKATRSKKAAAETEGEPSEEKPKRARKTAKKKEET